MHWLDVDGIGRFRVRHDRRRIGIHQDDPVALFLERFAGLRARVIKFTCLADHNRTSANNQDAFDIGSLRHC
jgi:hypothetical protein